MLAVWPRAVSRNGAGDCDCRTLKLGSNQLSGAIPLSLGSMTGLT
jgi:hypothetical protein